MKVERLGPTKFRVTPVEPGKAIRNVEFLLNGFEGETGSRIDCYEEGTLVSCPSNIHARLCSHCFAAIGELLLENESAE